MRNEMNVISCKVSGYQSETTNNNVCLRKEALCRGWKNDFRVTVFKSDVSKILDSQLWPKGIIVFVCGDYYATKVEGN